jgi:hypothetical protein
MNYGGWSKHVSHLLSDFEDKRDDRDTLDQHSYRRRKLRGSFAMSGDRRVRLSTLTSQRRGLSSKPPADNGVDEKKPLLTPLQIQTIQEVMADPKLDQRLQAETSLSPNFTSQTQGRNESIKRGREHKRIVRCLLKHDRMRRILIELTLVLFFTRIAKLCHAKYGKSQKPDQANTSRTEQNQKSNSIENGQQREQSLDG